MMTMICLSALEYMMKANDIERTPPQRRHQADKEEGKIYGGGTPRQQVLHTTLITKLFEAILADALRSPMNGRHYNGPHGSIS